jgi:Protein  of unknown function (DUF3018)
MGKHEVIKPGSGTKSSAKSTERVRKHRAEMRAKGYRLKQVWVRDKNDPAYLAEIERTNRAVADWERNNPDEAAFWDEITVRAWNDLPDR